VSKVGSRNTGVDLAMLSTEGPAATGENHVGLQGEEPRIRRREPTEEEIVREVYEFAAGQMESGASEQQVHDILIENGLDPESAMIVVSNLTRMRAEAVGAAGKKEMLHGALWCIGGIAVTAVTYGLASEGVPFIVAFGAIIFGAIQFFRGLVQWIRK
jgi:hypothetical protein